MLTDFLYRFLIKLNACPDIFKIEQLLKMHPQDNSMRGISDILEKNGIYNIVCSIDRKQLHEIPLPAVIHAESLGKNPFFMVDHIDFKSDTVRLIGVENNRMTVPLQFFLTIWNGFILLAESAEKKPNHYKRLKSRFKRLIWMTEKKLHIVLLILLLLFVPLNITDGYNYGLLQLISIVLGVCGVIISYMAVVKGKFGVDTYKLLCSVRNEDMCRSVFSDKGAYIMGWISLGELSLAYFLALLVIDIFNPASELQIVVSLLSMTAVLYSIIWQISRKKRCGLCLLIDAVLVFYLLTECTELHDLHETRLLTDAVGYFFLFTVCMLGTRTITSLLKTRQDCNEMKDRLGKFIASEDAFIGMLSSQPQLPKEAINNLSPLVNGITGGHELLVIMSPKCRYCRDLAHILMRLTDNVGIKILFLVDKEDHISVSVASGILSMRNKFDFKEIMSTLCQWYDKNIQPNTETDKHYEEILLAQCQFSHRIGITGTPTVFVDNRRLPEAYTFYDIEYIIG